jgi:hypothetical protein
LNGERRLLVLSCHQTAKEVHRFYCKNLGLQYHPLLIQEKIKYLLVHGNQQAY